MSLFSKKDKKKEEEFNTDKKAISKNLYTIILKEKIGKTEGTFATFQAQRWFEDDSEIAFLKNNKNGFLEVIPEQEVDFRTQDIDKLKKERTELREILEKINNESDPEIIMKTWGNPKNHLFKLATIEAKIRALKYESREYMTFGLNGEKEYTFLRTGSNFIPRAVDVDTFTAFYPVDSKKKSFAFTHRNKQNKHGMGKKLMDGALMMAWLFGIGFLFATGYFMFQAHKSYTESEVVQARNLVLESSGHILINNKKQSDEITKIYTGVAEKLLEPTIIIEGVQPR